jgi:hypothetical protein
MRERAGEDFSSVTKQRGTARESSFGKGNSASLCGNRKTDERRKKRGEVCELNGGMYLYL